MRNICVFCGSAKGQGDKYLELARDLGKKIADGGFGLIYGGASIGVMGEMANATLAAQGQVTGIMPKSLVNWEVGHSNLSKFEIVETMHERKQKMYDYSDVFLAIPGGMGTLDELFEILTWAQLQYHRKPIYILNFNGFFDHLIAHLQNAVKEGFIKKHHYDLLKVVNSLEDFFKEI